MPLPRTSIYTTHVHAKPSLGLHESHSCQGNMLSLFHAHAPCAHELHHTLAPCPWLHALARVTTTPCSCLKLMPWKPFLLRWAPCHVPSSLSATTSHDVAPMTPHLCTRHWALASCLDSASLLLHPSNKPWHYAHGSSRRLAQGIAPLCHCREGSLHHTSCHCGHGLHTTTHCGAYMWVSTRLAPCSLLVLEALHWGPCCGYIHATLSHLSPPPFKEHFRPF